MDDVFMCGDTTLHRYLVALGANLGDRQQNLTAALSLLRGQGATLVALAPIFETAPLGPANQDFLNTAALFESGKAPLDFLQMLLATEDSLGRKRLGKWENRSIDLDILLWQDLASNTLKIWSTDGLNIPHPEMLHRDFVLVPAAAIAGDWIHPLSNLSLREECDQRGFFCRQIT